MSPEATGPAGPTDRPEPSHPTGRTGPVGPVAHVPDRDLEAYLAKTRWFGGKGRPFAIAGVRRLGRLGGTPGQRPGGTGTEPVVDVLLVELTYADVPPGAPESTELYQVPLALYTDPAHHVDHAFVGWWEDPALGWVHAYDALHDRHATALWLSAFTLAADGAPAEAGGLSFHRLPGNQVDPDAVGSLFTGEQSNSSVAFGEDAVLKVFRKVTPGANPDITTHDVLTRADSPDVAHLYGWVETELADPTGSAGGVVHLGMLQQFLRTATDGWDLALASVRTLFADEELAARESGGDFSGESARLGLTLREVHALLREHLPTGPAAAPDPPAVAAGMRSRLDAAARVVPALTPHVERIGALYDRLGALPSLTVQRVHGDLHLGQTLRTALGWKIVDFEGEPAKPLAERTLPDSPWRDVAGMLRSFDYAPHVVERQHAELDEERVAERRASGQEWAERNQRYFLRAYADGDLTPEQDLVVHAYLADKACYEVVYETRNRPEWVDIPLAAVARIGA